MTKALIVDDDEKNRRLIEDLLSIKNIDAISFEKGRDAVNAVSSDLIFCIIDVRLPDIPGFDVAKNIKKKYPDMPCIAYTASALEESIQKLKKIHVFDDIIIKPIDINSFFKIIEKYVKH